MDLTDSEKVKNKLEFWSQELHDMSGRNRLLFHKETKTSTATIELPAFLTLFEMLVDRGSEILAPLPESKEAQLAFGDLDKTAQDSETDLKAKSVRALRENEIQTNHTIPVLNRVLYNLRYSSHTIQEEQGFNVLYVTFGMLKWKEVLTSDFNSAPLILVPVQLFRDSPISPYRIVMAEDDIVLNPVLQTKLAKDFGIQLPEITNDLSAAQLTGFLDAVTEETEKMEGWEVVQKATIGIFNFLTLLLIKDFENHADLYCQHQIVQRLSGVDTVNLFAVDGVPQGADLDDKVDPASVFQIMDADSSQQEAIEAAKRGLSFVLQGPPGTGKSQTIANIMAEFMMAGKRVLFVSQKMAALAVVQNRLKRKGIGEFCLQVHSHKMDKREVIDDLMRSWLNSQSVGRPIGLPGQQQELKAVRDELNGYARQLHERRLDLGMSFFEAQGHLADFFDAPQLNFSLSDLRKMSPATLHRMTSLVRETANYPHIIATYRVHRWTGFNAVQISIQEREGLAEHLQGTADAIAELAQRIREIVGSYDLPRPESIGDCLAYLAVFKDFTPGVFSASLEEPIENYLSRYRSVSRYLSPQYWRDSKALRAVYRARTRPAPDEISPILKLVNAIRKAGDQPIGEITADLDKVSGQLERLKSLRSRILHGFDRAMELFDKSNLPECLERRTLQSPTETAEWFADHGRNTGELADWASFNALRRECEESELGDFVTKAIETELRPTEWEQAFLRRFYLLLGEELISDRPLLQKFRGTLHTELVRRFRELDVAMIEGAPAEIRAKLRANRPQASWISAGSAETSILKREYNKKRRLLPLRRLFREIPNLIQLLKPCLMMSPLTVCQLLDPAVFRFDVVIFDEASQIPPEYAISAFLRGSQVVVAGDRQQLPPTNFFHAIEADEFDDNEDEYYDENVSFESILNACDSSGFPSKLLNWHYRSKDESLIAYSNYHFYENRLFTFPNSNSSRLDTGLEWVHLEDGTYKRGAGARHNLKEAAKVAELVQAHLMRTPELSLGIVAFSLSQRRAIEAAIEYLRKENPELSAQFSDEAQEPIFIKNLENVQGDERDVIILSVGYGRDEVGKMTLNFGPLNREGGARRLNVAVTRARYALKLVASIEPEDIDLSRVSSQGGAGLLRNYLEAARDGVRAIYKDERVYSDAEFDSPFEAAVSRALVDRGVLLKPQVGVSQYRIDLGVVDPDQPGRFLLGIECDGAMYHSAVTARDRDRLRQQVLENLGWKIHRIWSRDWIQNRESEIERVLQAIDLAKTAAHTIRPTPTAPLDDAKSDLPGSDMLPSTGPEATPNGNPYPPGAVAYRARRLQRQPYTGGDAILRTPLHRIISAFKLIIDAEGPMAIEVAKRRVLDAWDARKGSNINHQLNLAIAHGVRQKTFVQRGNFLWPIGMEKPALRIHTPGMTARAIDEIAPEEIALAVYGCVQGAIAIDRDDLERESLRLFGLNATRANSRRVEAIVAEMITEGVLNAKAGKISLGKNL